MRTALDQPGPRGASRGASGARPSSWSEAQAVDDAVAPRAAEFRPSPDFRDQAFVDVGRGGVPAREVGGPSSGPASS